MNIANKIALLFIFSFFLSDWTIIGLTAQTPFIKSGQIFSIFNSDNNLAEMSINPSNNSMLFGDLNADLGVSINALGFRKTDALLYGIEPTNHILFRIDANGVIETLGALNLNPTNFYLAGDVTIDGQYLVAIGSENGVSNSLVKIDLEDPNYTVETLSLNGGMDIRDLAFDPTSGIAYGYDGNNKRIIIIDANNGATTALQPFAAQNDGFGVYFNAFGDLFVYGNTVFGIIDALFSVDKTTGDEFQIGTGAVMPLADMASCPYSVEIRNAALPSTIFPCSEIEYEYTLANQSGQILTEIDMEQQLPLGFTLLGITDNPLGGTQDMSVAPATLRIENMTIPSGIHTLKILVEVGDIPANEYNSQAILSNLPPDLGLVVNSDNPESPVFEDSTLVEVIRIEEDSIFNSNLVCEGDNINLDADGFGNNILWNNGSTDLQLNVNTTGTYYFNAISGCQSVYVGYNVTVATCPFTISLDLTIDPAESLPCSEVIYRFYLDNDSGGERNNVGLVDTLPEGFKLLSVLNNPYGGQLKSDLPENVICIEGMTLSLDLDSLEFLVEIGEVNPGIYKNRGKLYNLPAEIGMFRLSDDPSTLPIDSTALKILGTESDTLYLEEYICPNEDLLLDVSDFGIDFTWSDGNTDPQYLVTKPGNYDVVLFNGCEPTYIFYTVLQAPDIEVETAFEQIKIFQSETLELALFIENADDSLTIHWTDLLDATFACEGCQTIETQPWFDTAYGVRVANEYCQDSLTIFVEIEENRRIYAPNAFSPNGDGYNDIFYLQTPDFGKLKSLKVFDRWGSLLYSTNEAQMNSPLHGWDGGWSGQLQYSGVFVWEAVIEFIDGTESVFAGSVGILK